MKDMVTETVKNRKTLIGATLMFALYGAKGLGWIDESTFNQLGNIAEAVIGIGLAHKVVKTAL